MEEHKITFGTLNPDGTLTNVKLIKRSDIVGCPFYIMVPDHYRDDGSCKCNDPVYREKVMKGWGYKKKDFIRVGLIKKGEVR